MRNLDPESLEPRGRLECLQEAVTHLVSQLAETGTAHALYRDAAEEEVRSLVLRFNSHFWLHRRAPRIKHVAKGLEDLRRSLRKLTQSIEQTDDFLRRLFQTAGHKNPAMRTQPEAALAQQVEIADFPLPGSEGGGTFVDRLKALSAYTDLVRSNFFTEHGVRNPESPDRGGNTNLYRSEQGLPAFHLVVDGWRTYERFNPGQASGYVGGPFHLFLMSVFEYATGLDPEEHSKLAGKIKRLAKDLRRDGELRRERRSLRDRAKSIQANSHSQRAAQDQLDEINVTLRTLASEHNVVRHRIEAAKLPDVPKKH